MTERLIGFLLPVLDAVAGLDFDTEMNRIDALCWDNKALDVWSSCGSDLNDSVSIVVVAEQSSVIFPTSDPSELAQFNKDSVNHFGMTLM